MDASAPCVKKARVAPFSVHLWTAHPSAAVKTETDTLSGDDAPFIHMMNGVNCLPNPSVAPSVGPFGRDEGIADRGSRVRVRDRAPQSCFEERQPSRSPSCEADVVTSTHVEAARSMDRHVANGAPSTNVSPSTHVEEAALSDKQFKDAKEKANAFARHFRQAPADVKALWENESKDWYRNYPKRYAFGISRTTCNTQMCLFVCFVGIHGLTCDCR